MQLQKVIEFRSALIRGAKAKQPITLIMKFIEEESYCG